MEGWDTVVGSSGTIKACRQIMVNMGLSDEQENVTREGLHKLKDKLLKFKIFLKLILKDFEKTDEQFCQPDWQFCTLF